MEDKYRDKILSIIKEILKQAREKHYPVGITTLVKLLYLLEIDYYRIHQKRLTKLQWKFSHYGPYAPEIEKILSSQDIDKEEIDISNDRIFRKIVVIKEASKKYSGEPEIPRLITRIVNEWGGENLYRLLDYVYFETEPMQNAKRGEVLDFSKINPWQTKKIKKIKIDQKKLSEIRKRVDEHMKGIKRPIIEVKADKVLSKCLEIWDEDSESMHFTGEVIVSTEHDDDQ